MILVQWSPVLLALKCPELPIEIIQPAVEDPVDTFGKKIKSFGKTYHEMVKAIGWKKCSTKKII